MNCTSAIGMFEAPMPGPSATAPQSAAEPGASFLAILGEQTQAQADPESGEMPICLFPTVDTGIDPEVAGGSGTTLSVLPEANGATRPSRAFRHEETENPENQGSDFSPIFVATQPMPAPIAPLAGSASLYTVQEPAPAAPLAPRSIHSQSASPARPTPQIETAGPSLIQDETEATTAVRQQLTFDIPPQDLDETPQPVQEAAAPPISKDDGAAQPVAGQTVPETTEPGTMPATVSSARPAGRVPREAPDPVATAADAGMTISSDGTLTVRRDTPAPESSAARWNRTLSEAEGIAAPRVAHGMTVAAADGAPAQVNSAAQWNRMLSDAEAFAVPATERVPAASAAEPAEAQAPAAGNAPVQSETAAAPASQMVTALDGVLTMANERTTAPETKRAEPAVRGTRERDDKPAVPAARQETASVAAPAAVRAAQVEAPVRAEIVRMAPGVEMTQRIEALHTAQAAARPAVQSFTVPIGQESNPVATLRLVQMGTGVRMTVQTTDTALSQSMQTHLPQLVRGLEDSGFRANFQPRTESTATMVPASTASADSRPMDSSDSGGARHEGPAHGQSRERRQPSHEWREWLQHGRRQNKEGR